MSQEDYALKLDISYSGAKSRVQRARFMLRDMIAKPRVFMLYISFAFFGALLTGILYNLFNI